MHLFVRQDCVHLVLPPQPHSKCILAFVVDQNLPIYDKQLHLESFFWQWFEMRIWINIWATCWACVCAIALQHELAAAAGVCAILQAAWVCAIALACTADSWHLCKCANVHVGQFCRTVLLQQALPVARATTDLTSTPLRFKFLILLIQVFFEVGKCEHENWWNGVNVRKPRCVCDVLGGQRISGLLACPHLRSHRFESTLDETHTHTHKQHNYYFFCFVEKHLNDLAVHCNV